MPCRAAATHQPPAPTLLNLDLETRGQPLLETSPIRRATAAATAAATQQQPGARGAKVPRPSRP